MAKTNFKPQSVHTYEGAKAKRITNEEALRRTVLTCMLWEKQFYESGEYIADRIAGLVPRCDPNFVAALAIGARDDMKLRHAPLWIVREMVKHSTHKHLVAETLAHIIQRPDELSEFLALYWRNKYTDKIIYRSGSKMPWAHDSFKESVYERRYELEKTPIAAQVKKGLALAFTKFDAYQLDKYDRPGEITLRDVLFLCHAKPQNAEQAAMWKQLVDGTLAPANTWEHKVSVKGADKKKEWSNLLKTGKIGALALLRNLRNMIQCDVDMELIREGLLNMKTERVLPFRFITAARYAPQLEPELEIAMFRCLKGQALITGETDLLLDVSGSMVWNISDKSELRRIDAACGLAMLIRELCERVNVYTFSEKLVQVPARRGFALRDAIDQSQRHSSTYLGTSIRALYARRGKVIKIKGHYSGHQTFTGVGSTAKRLIVLSDEQSHDPVPDPFNKGYMINVASAKYGIGYGAWTHCDGWSEAVIDWIQSFENEGFDKF